MNTTTVAVDKADVTAVLPNGNGRAARRDFLLVVGGCLIGCLGMQACLMYWLLSSNPPDASWELIKNLMSTLATIETGLMGGILGMARSGPA